MSKSPSPLPPTCTFTIGPLKLSASNGRRKKSRSIKGERWNGDVFFSLATRRARTSVSPLYIELYLFIVFTSPLRKRLRARDETSLVYRMAFIARQIAVRVTVAFFYETVDDKRACQRPVFSPRSRAKVTELYIISCNKNCFAATACRAERGAFFSPPPARVWEMSFV